MNNTRTCLALLGIVSITSHAALVGVTGDGDIISPAPSAVLDDGVTTATNRQNGFDENQSVLLVEDLPVDGGVIPAGTYVDSHMIFHNQVGARRARAGGVVWEFSGLVLGTMTDTDGLLEAASSPLLGALGTTYPAAGFHLRGLESSDRIMVAGNTVKLSTRVGNPGDWIRVVTASVDNDQDGTPNVVDHCPQSDTGATVWVLDKDTGIANRLVLTAPDGSVLNGCFLADIVNAIVTECAINPRNHGHFVRCVAHALNVWKKAGVITGAEKGVIVRCAARSDIGKKPKPKPKPIPKPKPKPHNDDDDDDDDDEDDDDDDEDDDDDDDDD